MPRPVPGDHSVVANVACPGAIEGSKGASGKNECATETHGALRGDHQPVKALLRCGPAQHQNKNGGLERQQPLRRESFGRGIGKVKEFRTNAEPRYNRAYDSQDDDYGRPIDKSRHELPRASRTIPPRYGHRNYLSARLGAHPSTDDDSRSVNNAFALSKSRR